MKILSINKLKGLRLYIHNISEYRNASLDLTRSTGSNPLLAIHCRSFTDD